MLFRSSLIFRQVTEVPAPLNQVAPDVPAAIADVVQKALAKEPRDRFASMVAFDRAIGNATSGAAQTVGRRMRVEDLQTRIAAMHRAIPGWTSPITIGALVLMLAGTWMTLRSMLPSQRSLSANREEAIFAAKSFLTGRGVAAPFRDATVFRRTSDEKYAFLA